MPYSIRTRRAILAVLALAAVLLATGCSRPADAPKRGAGESSAVATESPPPTTAETWDANGLAAAQPCVLVLSDEAAALRGVSLEGMVVAEDLWKPPASSAALLLDADSEGPRVALAVSRQPTETPAAIEDTLIVLDSDGAVRTASEPTSGFPLASAAVFVETGDLVWLRRRETETSIDTTLGVTDIGTGRVSPVVLEGAWPKHRFVASLVSLREPGSVAVILKTDGSPSPRDDFAVVRAEYRSGKLIATSAAYRDDVLFTLGPGPSPGTLVYARAENEESAQADELIELATAGEKLVPRTLLGNAGCDPGFEFQHVCSGGPNGSVLYRAAVDPSVSDPIAVLRMLPSGSTKPKDTGVRLDVVGNQWAWLAKPTR